MAFDPYTSKNNKKNRRGIGKPTNLDTTTSKPAKRYYQPKGAKATTRQKVAKHPPDPPRRQSIRPNNSTKTAAKHPPWQNNGNVSANE